jgi:hypothetical protein
MDLYKMKQRTPSKVDVPLPSSSRMTKLLLVAVRSISLVSVISTMKVERPLVKSSDAEWQRIHYCKSQWINQTDRPFSSKYYPTFLV